MRLLRTAIQTAIKRNNQKDARDALAAFRRAAIASPDLISSDARTLVDKAQRKVTEAFTPVAYRDPGANSSVEELADIGLYT
jgi:hypothetical protein